MCGLAGATVPGFDVLAALDLLEHRGPDARGSMEHLGVTHGHVRLAIRDPDRRSNQPFGYGDGVLSYNGELWNAGELRERLSSLGHEFRTTGDTEVLAAALLQWGEGALRRIDGMFCFAWTSPREQILVRDRLGKLPIYYCPLPRGGCVWASERKAFERKVCERSRAIPAGFLLDLKTLQLRRYFRLSPKQNPYPKDVPWLIERAVEKRMVSDVPICVLLSGGVDSSLITAIAAKRRPDIVAYVAYLDPESSDLKNARDTAERLKIELREVPLSDPRLQEVQEAIRVIEIPHKTGVEIAIPTIELARQIHRDGFKVVLTGEAADEIFGGYGTLMRAATDDYSWRAVRMEAMARMSRINFNRINKCFMAYSVEARMPFCDLELVETALGLGLEGCPPGKVLLRQAALKWLPAEVAGRKKEVFQGPSGVMDYLAKMFHSPVKVYNQECVNLYGRRMTE